MTHWAGGLSELGQVTHRTDRPPKQANLVNSLLSDKNQSRGQAKQPNSLLRTVIESKYTVLNIPRNYVLIIRQLNQTTTDFSENSES